MGDLYVALYDGGVAIVAAGAYGPTPLQIDVPNALGLGLDQAGNLYVGDGQLQLVDQYQMSTTPGLSFATTPVGSISSDSLQTVTVENIGNGPLIFSTP